MSAPRPRWDDDDLDRLHEQVRDLENEWHALRLIPDQVAHVITDTERLQDSADRAEERENHRVERLHEKIESSTKELRKEMREGFAQIAVPPAQRMSLGDWLKLIVAASAGIAVPIAAIIAARGGH